MRAGFWPVLELGRARSAIWGGCEWQKISNRCAGSQDVRGGLAVISWCSSGELSFQYSIVPVRFTLSLPQETCGRAECLTLTESQEVGNAMAKTFLTHTAPCSKKCSCAVQIQKLVKTWTLMLTHDAILRL